ncbi:hypothetical protein DPEC_G00178740 [Dallia pectoralis]|uniref:Uncharacterized protein n=1 Tax=Dallia pectoralis TaxID=75939 RepID=A0ACC2GF84_DALPE|nr:hypothetical protein DPEC_G00178740 [Dallia pectoralis]
MSVLRPNTGRAAIGLGYSRLNAITCAPELQNNGKGMLVSCSMQAPGKFLTVQELKEQQVALGQKQKTLPSSCDPMEFYPRDRQADPA